MRTNTAALLLMLLSVLADYEAHADDIRGRFDRFCTRSDQGRNTRGFDCGGLAFQFAPADGSGMTAACAGTNPTGSKGEALTFSRASNGTCQTTAAGGMSTTGIANGELIILTSNQPRVEFDAAGVRGLRVEEARTNTCIRSAELCNVAWADVGTPACASDAVAGPFGTTTMDTITDNDAVAFEGRSQAITTASATLHSVSCYVKSVSGTTAASITLVGTGSATGDCTGTATGLSTTTSTRVSCTSPAAYGGTLTAVTVTIRFGTVVADQGTLAVEGCQHEVAAAYPTSYIATVAASATRAVETASFVFPLASSATVSMACSVYGPTPFSGSAATALEFQGTVSLLNEASAGNWRWLSGGVSQLVALTSSAGGIRTYGYHDGSNRGMQWAANVAGPTADVNAGNKVATTLYVGGSGGNRPNDIISRACADPNPSACR